MGKAARRERRNARLGDRPQWAGAFGFQRAWKVNESYLDLAREILGATSGRQIVRAENARMRLRMQMLSGDIAVVERTADARADCDEREAIRQTAAEIASLTQRLDRSASPSVDPALGAQGEFDAAGYVAELSRDHPGTARALVALAESHREALRATTPIRFDPLDLPAVDSSTLVDVRLPFPTVTCDFLTPWGMSMPVVDSDGHGRWVGLVAATLQETASGIDVWPVVTTLQANRDDDRQSATALLFGRVRFGASLPPAPEGFARVSIGGGVSAWVLELCGEPNSHAGLWLDLPARAACSALQLLDAVNVSLEPARLDHREQRRVARLGAEPAREVVIRTSRRYGATARSGSVDYQHRWTVRGHPKLYTRGAIFNANPHKRVTVDGVECVKIWCPAFIKGPQDKPLILKSRRVVTPVEPSPSKR